ncbi:hypothetical protein FA743_13065 [Paracoccus gahaiensis]|uniref:Cellulose-binding protein n=1 Tax=Paracoccus gahaiensis TaxID=1706839 RepID=A0A4U0R7B8_9RHOB|nr:hypothetical protein [Paracoccus gahaiensis]TJZ90835.1 hypothetical protein FA743_13065 [Paracoccus gahaiensis]
MNRRSVLLLTLASYLQSSVAFARTSGTALQGGADPVRRPFVAAGLSGIADWQAAQPFIDVMRQSREWMARSPSEFVSHTNQQLREAGHLDADGWPVSIPEGATSVGTIILCDLSADDTSLNGHYRMTWQGTGTVVLNGTATNIRQGENSAEFDYVTSDTGIVSIDITQQDAADPVRNFVCVHEDLQAAHDAGEVFRPVWMELLQDFRLIRFMDWMGTNNSTLSDWEDRPKPSSATWTLGAPVEVMVMLANRLGIDPWFCMPHLATPDYITRFATYVHDNLDPSLTAHYEYSNEVWNFQFEQTQWALQQAEALWPGQGDGWMQFYGGKSVEMALLLDAVYADAPERYRKVITAHTAWIDLNHAALDAPNWVEGGQDRRPPKEHFDAYAVTGYFDGGLGRAANVELVQSWRDQGDEAAFALMSEQMMEGRHVQGDEAGTTMVALRDMWDAQKKIADESGLALVMYEGGSHIVPDHAALEADPTLLDFFARFHYSPEMGRIYTHALDSFAEAGGEFFNIFVAVSGPGRWGFWGARRHVLDDNPRWRAIVDHDLQASARQ